VWKRTRADRRTGNKAYAGRKTNEYLNYNQVNKEFTHQNQADYRALPAKVRYVKLSQTEIEIKTK